MACNSRGKKVRGRKRFIPTDSLGLIWAVWVTTADVRDRDGGRWLLSRLRHRLPRLREVIADSGFSRKLIGWVRRPLDHAAATSQHGWFSRKARKAAA